MLGQLASLKRALSRGADVNTRDDIGRTPLMWTAMTGHPRIAKFLIKTGADVNIHDDGKWTALMQAADYGHADVVTVLLHAKADVNAENNAGWTALMIAAEGGYPDMARDLIQHKEHVNAQNKSGKTALMVAAQNDNTGVVTPLMEAGADINIRDNSGWTALMYAVRSGYTDATKLLLHDGADPNLENAQGETASDIANIAGHGDITSLLDAEPARSQGIALPVKKIFFSEVDSPLYRLPERPHDIALVIGIEHYIHDLPQAEFADRDAQAVKAHLVALGFPQWHIKTLIDDRATKSDLLGYIEDWLPKNVKPDGRVFIYFSGHGVPDARSGEAYLVPVDGDPNFLSKTAIRISDLYKDLSVLNAKKIIVTLDSCFSGSGARSVSANGIRPMITKVTSLVPPSGKILVFAAARGTETAGIIKSQGHGLFTYYFLRGIDHSAQKHRNLTPRSLFDYLKIRVEEKASLKGRDQIPILAGNASGTLFTFR
jgi:ankyrin repeat protein